MLELFRVFASMEFSRLGSSSTSKVTDSREASFLNRRLIFLTHRRLMWSPKQDAMDGLLTSRRWLGALSLGPPGRSLHVTGSPVRLLQQLAPRFRFRGFQSSLALSQPPVATPYASGAAKGGTGLVGRNFQGCGSLSFPLFQAQAHFQHFALLLWGSHLWRPSFSTVAPPFDFAGLPRELLCLATP